MHKEIEDPEGYEDHWNYTEFKDKIILDLGADYGSTASWFFKKGAKKVISVECDRNRFSQLIENFGEDQDVVCIKEKVNTKEQFNDLVTKYSPDITKVDIEGSEEFFLTMVNDELRRVKEYLIEYHGKKLLGEICTKFVKAAFNVRVCWINPWERDECGVIYAKIL